MTRSLFGKCGVRNGATVDTVSLRCGAVDGWLPKTARALAFLMQQGTSREAEASSRELGVLPYSRSSFERVGHDVGRRYSDVRYDVEDALIRGYVVPREARSISVSLDRVAVPFEELRTRSPGRPPKGAPKRPINRVRHMVYVATVTIHDGDGEALHTIRYGRVPDYGSQRRPCVAPAPHAIDDATEPSDPEPHRRRRMRRSALRTWFVRRRGPREPPVPSRSRRSPEKSRVDDCVFERPDEIAQLTDIELRPMHVATVGL